MKLKSETKQLITFLKHIRNTDDTESVANICYDLKLNIDMVTRSLIMLHKEGIIGRVKNGPNSRYVFTKDIGLGTLVKVVEGVSCFDENISIELVEMLNQIKI